MIKILWKLAEIAAIFVAFELSALGWRLQGGWMAVFGAVVGVGLVVWVRDWEVRGILRREREMKKAARLA